MATRNISFKADSPDPNRESGESYGDDEICVSSEIRYIKHGEYLHTYEITAKEVYMLTHRCWGDIVTTRNGEEALKRIEQMTKCTITTSLKLPDHPFTFSAGYSFLNMLADIFQDYAPVEFEVIGGNHIEVRQACYPR